MAEEGKRLMAKDMSEKQLKAVAFLNEQLQRDHNRAKDIFIVEAGQVILEWPRQISLEEFKDTKKWLALVVRKMERLISAKPQTDLVQGPERDADSEVEP